MADIPFPFPYSNAIILILMIYTLTVPLLMWIWVKSLWFGALLAFIATFTYWTLNEIARDLEDPFLYEPNDLPLVRRQFLFNERILAIERETGSMERPPSQSALCNAWLGQNGPMSYQTVESHGIYEKIDWSNVSQRYPPIRLIPPHARPPPFPPQLPLHHNSLSLPTTTSSP